MKLFEVKEDNCKKCGLYKDCNSPKMMPSGQGRTECLIIAESPGKNEDEQGVQLVGDSGQLLRDRLDRFGYHLDRDFWKINAVNCWTNEGRKKSRTPKASEIKFCKPYVDSVINDLKPKYIILMGNTALDSFFLGDFEKTSINDVRGMQIYDQKYNTFVLPVYHPSYILRNEYDRNLDSVYMRDLRTALRFIDSKPEFSQKEYPLEILYSYKKIISFLKTILETKKPVYFDYETTALKPFKPGNKILCVSMTQNKKTIVFPFQYRDYFSQTEQKTIRKYLQRIFAFHPLEAHNMGFEDSWTRNIIGIKPKRWNFDSFIAAHILDNRPGIAGLKMQTYINFGIRPYDSDVKKYIKGDDEGFNRMEEVPLEKLLLYCGNDSKYGAMLSARQKKQLKHRNLVEAYQLFHKGAILLAQMHQNGICADEDYFNEQDKILEEKITTMNSDLLSSKEAKLFKKHTGRELNLGSTKDLGILFYDIMKVEVKKTTVKGTPSLDKAALDRMDISFAKNLLEMRKLDKAKGTYLAQFKREIINGKINTFLGLGNVSSYRSSSNSPNMQNQPTRDEMVKKLIRSGIKASPGRSLFFYDFVGAEVKTSAVYHRDPKMIEYITDPSTDMHRDAGMDIFILPLEEMTKEIRFYAKNQWVFAQFYGSYWKDCGENLWSECIQRQKLCTKSGILLEDHLRKNGIKTKDQFLAHCEQVERIFWGERFKVYSEWKKTLNEFYQNNGYVETHMGFKFTGYMDRKQVSNYPIQGESFHILLWCMLELDKISKEEGWKSDPVLEIHDEEVFDAVPEEVPRIAEAVLYVVKEKLPKTFNWICVPYDVEFSITPVGGSWYEKQDWQFERK